MKKDKETLPESPGLLTRIRGSLSSLRRGGDDQAWREALFGIIHESERVRQKSLKLAKRLHAAKISARNVNERPYFQVLDYLVVHDRPSAQLIQISPVKEAENLQIISDMYDVFEMALECGMKADQKHSNNYNDYGLHRAAAAGSSDTVNLLIKHNASLISRDGNGFTPLSCALSGWGERKGKPERRMRAVRALIEAGAPLDKAKTKTIFAREEAGYKDDKVIEISLLDDADEMPGMLVELIKLGAPLSWEISLYYIEETQLIPGENFTHPNQHIFFSFDSKVWDWRNKATLLEFFQELEERTGPLHELISTRGFTTAMEMFSKPDTLGIEMYGEFDKTQALLNIDEMIKANIIKPEERTQGGSSIWHALFTHPNERTEDLTYLLLDHYPDVAALIDEPNSAGIRPWDILQYHRHDYNSKEIKSNKGLIKVNLPYYGQSWESTLDSLISVISQKRLRDISDKVREGKKIPEPDFERGRRTAPKL